MVLIGVMYIYKLYICIIILIILSILWYITNRSIETFRIFEKCDYDHYVMSKKEIQLSYKLIRDVTNTFDKYGVKYFMVGGTLLGSIRHGGIIPWDDDMDIAVIDSDIEKTHRALTQLAKEGKIRYKTIEFGIIKIYSVHSKEYPFIDLFFYTREDDKYLFKEQSHRDIWPNEWFHKSELFPLQKGKFGPLQLNTPFAPIPHIERAFGTNWNTEYKGAHTHKEGASLEKSEGILTDKLLCHF